MKGQKNLLPACQRGCGVWAEVSSFKWQVNWSRQLMNVGVSILSDHQIRWAPCIGKPHPSKETNLPHYCDFGQVRRRK